MDSQSLVLWYPGALIFGAGIAWTIVAIFSKLVPPGTTRRYWTDVSNGIHGLIYGDEALFWSHYGKIIQRSVGFVFRQLAGLALAFAPLVLALLYFGPWVFAQWDKGAEFTVHPANSVQWSAHRPSAASPPEFTLHFDDGDSLSTPPVVGSMAICKPGSFGCLVLRGFGFTVIVSEQATIETDGPIIIRSDHDDWNPLWPYLNDPEFLFFLSLSVCSLGLLFRTGKKASAPEGEYSIGLVDYMLTLLATHGIRGMNRIGQWESRWNAGRIAETKISKPIFIAGLARSGTTILLEKIATISGVATHRYRDFPFIMTPILWNRALSLLGTDQKPVERPHRDKIRITRDSPDAFEEPIWQYYFPWIHDIKRSHILPPGEQAPGFRKFYVEHIKKIILVRRGSRYVSKGNYNLPRIQFISSVFPDALFIVPVRHPLTHILSLARQHEIFIRYAERDPKVAAYLSAVGHYEFGPQRAPVCLTAEGGRRAQEAWELGDQLLGYALQWNDVYAHMIALSRANPDLAARIQFVRFEDLCAEPKRVFTKVIRFADLGPVELAEGLSAGINEPRQFIDTGSSEYDQYWQVTEKVAGWYGYSRNPKAERGGAGGTG